MLSRAREIAEEVLFPAASEVDEADAVPPAHLDLLAAEGFYGVAADDDIDMGTMGRIVETLASGCLTTAFVWIQHHTPVRALVGTPNASTWLPALTAGERRAGIGVAGIRTPQPLAVRPEPGGFRLHGTIPWVTGWGMIDTLWIAARDGDDVRFLLVDVPDGLDATVQRLSAVQASNTVNVTADGHFVPADRLVLTQTYDEWSAGDSGGSAMNGFLSLGVVDRCVRLLRAETRVPRAAAVADRLAAAADRCRTDLTEGPTPPARAAVSALAWRAAGALTVATGARAVLRSGHAQRLAREAAFLQVFGSRPAIRDILLD